MEKFYTYVAFIEAAKSFSSGWATAPEGPYSWGYCFIQERNPTSNYCQSSMQWPSISFKTALWFWMTSQSPKPSCHDVVTRQWQPSSTDVSAGRLPGYEVITNVINGGIECNKGPNDSGKDRIGFYQRYCSLMGVSEGDNLDCYYQRPFGI
ncbi:hypothetical protein MKX01_038291 [Papaver californicum]|nr:hypothetical protein MKX01_038291 [Papaver californicum]